MTQAADVVVHRQIVVQAPLERAFALFTERFGDSKPPEHNLLGVAIAETVFEPKVGGHIYDRGVDGSECRWARVLAYEPPGRVVFSWDISPQWQIETDPDHTSEVEVRFVAETPQRTRVELEHRHLGRHGPGWQAVRDGVGHDEDGRCTLPGTPPWSTRAADMAPIITSTEVDRSVDDVFAYATDPTRFHEWQAGVVDGHLDQPGIPAVGMRCLTTPAHPRREPVEHLRDHAHRPAPRTSRINPSPPARSAVPVTFGACQQAAVLEKLASRAPPGRASVGSTPAAEEPSGDRPAAVTDFPPAA